MTIKAVLKSDSKGFKVGGKTLTFDIVGKSIKTKIGQFIEGKVKRLHFATKISVAQQFSTTYQTYLELQVSGNILGVKKIGSFCHRVLRAHQRPHEVHFTVCSHSIPRGA